MNLSCFRLAVFHSGFRPQVRWCFSLWVRASALLTCGAWTGWGCVCAWQKHVCRLWACLNWAAIFVTQRRGAFLSVVFTHGCSHFSFRGIATSHRPIIDSPICGNNKLPAKLDLILAGPISQPFPGLLSLENTNSYTFKLPKIPLQPFGQ